MKTIVYQLFIYFFLTTICGTISKSVTGEANKGSTTTTSAGKSTTNICHLRDVVDTLNETTVCKQRNSSMSTVDYLCKGIQEGVDTICRLNPDLTYDPPTPNKSMKNINKFCNAMNDTKDSVSKRTEATHLFNKSKSLLDYNDCVLLCKVLEDDVVEDPLCFILSSIGNKLLFAMKTISIDQKATSPQNDASKKSLNESAYPTEMKIVHNDVADRSKLSNKSLTSDNTITPNTMHQPQVLPLNDTTAPELPKLPAKIPQLDTAVRNSQKISKPVSDVKPSSDKPDKNSVETQDNGAAQVPPNGKNDKGNKQNTLETPSMMIDEEKAPPEEEKMENPPRSDDNTDGKSISTIDERLPNIKDHDIDIDPPRPGETPGDNEKSVVAYPGPSEPPQHFFVYFMAISVMCLLCYIGYHNKHRIMAIIFEGRKSRGGRGRRRPNTASYRKLDCNLEEAVTSQCNSNVTHVIY